MTAPFLIIGGYGTVGSFVVGILRTIQPDLPLAIGGRSADKATQAAAQHENVVGLAVDTTREDLGLPAGQDLSGIAMLTNDLSTHPAQYAMRHGIPYTSIATQLTHLGSKLALHISNAAKSVALILDTSFAGTLIAAGLHLANGFATVSKIDIGAVMDDEDLGGPAARSDGDDFAQTPAGLILADGVWKKPDAEQEARAFALLDGSSYTGFSFPSIDLPDLVEKTGATSARLDFALAESPQRRAGGAPSVEILYEIEGVLPDGETASLKAQLTHPKGQSYLTALGVAIAIETLTGAVGEKPANGVYLPSSLLSPEHVVARLQEAGATLDVRTEPR